TVGSRQLATGAGLDRTNLAVEEGSSPLLRRRGPDLPGRPQLGPAPARRRREGLLGEEPVLRARGDPALRGAARPGRRRPDRGDPRPRPQRIPRREDRLLRLLP